MENLWVIKDLPSEKSTENLIKFINEQVKYLSEGTSGKVQANFIPRRSTMFEALGEMVLSTSSFSSNRNRKGEDASKLYRKSQYEFFISDNKSRYELAVFDLLFNDSYPVKIFIESDIATEAKLEKEIEIQNIQQFQDIFQKIIQSNKVVYIIGKLMKLPDEVECSSEVTDNENPAESGE